MDLMDEWSIPLPKTWAAWRTGEGGLPEVFADELSENAEEIVALAPSLDGWPEDAEATVSELCQGTDALTATAAIRYTEIIPSGCSDMPHRIACDVRVIITLHSATADAQVEFSPGEPEGWELDERNSAADGC